MMLGQDQQKLESEQGLPEDKSKFIDNKPPKPEDDESSSALARRAHIKKWQKRISDAKDKWKDDYDRMRDNMDFVAGLQWSGQKKITHSQYIVNMTLRTINQRVATLYARNPRVSAKRRPRLDFQLWDGNPESIIEAIMQATQLAQTGIPVPPQIMALFEDYQAGRQRQQLFTRVGDTLEKVYHYQQDELDPAFKTQMKQLVRRVSVCGVGYIKTQFCRDYETELTQSETRLNMVDRARRAQAILEKIEKGKVQPEQSEMQEVKMLLASLTQPSADDYEQVAVKEHLIFDFPKATSIIPDENCSILRGFVGAHWIAEEFRWDVDFVNAYFEKDIQPNVDVKLYGPDAKPVDSAMTASQDKTVSKNKMQLWQVWDLDTKSTFVIADGYKEYIQVPEVVSPAVKGFWQHVPVTFNDIEVEEGCKATIFPPSDVDLIRHPQEQLNRCRNSESRHRVANRPRAMTSKGMLSTDDLDSIANADDNQIVELEKVPPGTEPGKVLQPLVMTPFQPELYDTQKYQEDAMLSAGVQEANVGPAQPHVTATVGTIAEQSRVTVTSSDVDALDDGLTDVAKMGGEMLLSEMSRETVMRIAGPGAVWPEQDRQDFLNELNLEIVAASSGRPNKAVEIANLDKVIPLVLQAVQLPPQAQPTIQAIIKLVLKTLDSDVEPTDFFPVPMPMQPTPEQQQPSENTGAGNGGMATRGGNGNGGPPSPQSRTSKKNKQPARPGQPQMQQQM